MRFVKLHFFLFIVLLLGACKKHREHPVPSVAFDFQIDMTLPSYSDLNGVGGWCYVNGGIKGIVVYRRSYDQFVAWERMSPEDPKGVCESGLTTNPDNFLQLDDPCSDAQFSMYDGSPIANSDWGLRGYLVEWNGGNILRISN